MSKKIHEMIKESTNLTGQDLNELMKSITYVDFNDLEKRTLAYLQEDAENMSEGQIFNRASDPDGLDTHKLRQLLAVKVQKNELEEGCPDPVDFHTKKAAELFAVREEDVTPKQRAFAKSYSFADMYGATDETKSRLFRSYRIEARDRFKK